MKNSLLNYIGVTIVLFLFWVAVSGSLKWPQLLVGLAAAVFVTYFNRRLLITAEERPPVRFKTVAWLIGYIFQLIFDIVKANFQVAWLVLHPKMPIEPHMVSLDAGLNRVTARVLLANSITLTPGTLTVLADENQLLVHALTFKSGENLEQWPLIKRLQKMEEEDGA